MVVYTIKQKLFGRAHAKATLKYKLTLFNKIIRLYQYYFHTHPFHGTFKRIVRDSIVPRYGG